MPDCSVDQGKTYRQQHIKDLDKGLCASLLLSPFLVHCLMTWLMVMLDYKKASVSQSPTLQCTCITTSVSLTARKLGKVKHAQFSLMVSVPECTTVTAGQGRTRRLHGSESGPGRK